MVHVILLVLASLLPGGLVQGSIRQGLRRPWQNEDGQAL